MKKPVVLIAFLLSAGTLLGQFTAQGNFMMGSTLGFSAANSTITQDYGTGDVAKENPTYTQFSIAPSVGYFLIDNLALGIGLDYTFNQVKNPNQATNKDPISKVNSRPSLRKIWHQRHHNRTKIEKCRSQSW